MISPERACIGALNADGIISIIQMNVHIELGGTQESHSALVSLGEGFHTETLILKISERDIARPVSLARWIPSCFSNEHDDESFVQVYMYQGI